MKKTQIVAILLALLLLPTIALAQNKGELTYSNADLGMSFSYPSTWVELSSDDLTEEELNVAAETIGVPKEMVETVAANVAAYFIDMGNVKDEFAPNMNLVTTEIAGLTDDAIDDPAAAAEIKGSLEAQMTQAQATLTWIEEPATKPYGDLSVLWSSFDLTIGEVSVTECQAIFVHGGVMYVLTFTTHADSLDADAVAVIESILMSVTFA